VSAATQAHQCAGSALSTGRRRTGQGQKRGGRRRGPVLLGPARRQGEVVEDVVLVPLNGLRSTTRWRRDRTTWQDHVTDHVALQGPALGVRLGRGRACGALRRVVECVGGGSVRVRADAGLAALVAVDGQSALQVKSCAHADQAGRRVRQVAGLLARTREN